MSLVDDATREALRLRYAAAGRHYHDLRHVKALLALLETHRSAFADPEAVEAAIWFHDAIYDSSAHDNEARSAELAALMLAGTAAPERIARIVRMIEATAGHAVPEAGDAGERADTALFLDMDLSILAADPSRYDAYEEEVRREYQWVDDQTWRQRRALFLTTFLARPRIFHTELFRRELEQRARENMARSLANLSASRSGGRSGTRPPSS